MKPDLHRCAQAATAVALLCSLVACAAEDREAVDSVRQVPAESLLKPADPLFTRIEGVGNAPHAVVGGTDAVWVWLSDGAEAKLRRVSSSGEIRDWSLGPALNPVIPGSGGSLLREAPDGSLWLASGRRLVQIRPFSEQPPRVLEVPRPENSAIAAAHSPPQLVQEGGWISDMIIGPGGQVVLSFVLGGELVTLEPDSGKFSTGDLPDLGEPASLGVLKDGTMGVGFGSYEQSDPGRFLVIPPVGPEVVVRVEAIHVAGSGSSFIVGAIGYNRVLPDGTVQRLEALQGSNSRFGAVPLANGQVLAMQGQTPVLARSGDTLPQKLPLGTFPCPQVPARAGAGVAGGPRGETLVDTRLVCEPAVAAVGSFDESGLFVYADDDLLLIAPGLL